MQFKSLGRFSRTSKTPGAGYVRTQCLPVGSGSSNFGFDIMGFQETFLSMDVYGILFERLFTMETCIDEMYALCLFREVRSCEGQHFPLSRGTRHRMTSLHRSYSSCSTQINIFEFMQTRKTKWVKIGTVQGSVWITFKFFILCCVKHEVRTSSITPLLLKQHHPSQNSRRNITASTCINIESQKRHWFMS